jgi:hypothetical protein
LNLAKKEIEKHITKNSNCSLNNDIIVAADDKESLLNSENKLTNTNKS